MDYDVIGIYLECWPANGYMRTKTGKDAMLQGCKLVGFVHLRSYSVNGIDGSLALHNGYLYYKDYPK